jgi:hypothetical protein
MEKFPKDRGCHLKAEYALSASVGSRFLLGEIGSAQSFGLGGLFTRSARWLEASFYEADTLSWYYDRRPLNPARV